MTLVQAISDIVRAALSQIIISSASPEKTNHVIDNGALQNLQLGGFEDELETLVREEVKKAVGSSEAGGAGAVGDSQGNLTGEGLGIAKTLMTAPNAASIVSMGIPLLPQSVLVGFVVSLIPIIIEEIYRPGGPGDLRVRRIMEDENNAHTNRGQQKSIELGYSGIQLQSSQGFVAGNGANNSNTLRLVKQWREDRDVDDRIKVTEHSERLK